MRNPRADPRFRGGRPVDIEAIDRVLDSFGYQGPLEGRTPRAARPVLFYRNELRQFLQAELQRAGRPMSTRELAQIICRTERRNPGDRRLLADVTKRASKALREMRRLGIIVTVSDKGRNFVWECSSQRGGCLT
jgi:hypothetical protein